MNVADLVFSCPHGRGVWGRWACRRGNHVRQRTLSECPLLMVAASRYGSAAMGTPGAPARQKRLEETAKAHPRWASHVPLRLCPPRAAADIHTSPCTTPAFPIPTAMAPEWSWTAARNGHDQQSASMPDDGQPSFEALGPPNKIAKGRNPTVIIGG